MHKDTVKGATKEATGSIKEATGKLERLALITGGLMLVYPGALSDLIGVGLVVAVIAIQWLRRRRTVAV